MKSDDCICIVHSQVGPSAVSSLRPHRHPHFSHRCALQASDQYDWLKRACVFSGRNSRQRDPVLFRCLRTPRDCSYYKVHFKISGRQLKALKRRRSLGHNRCPPRSAIVHKIGERPTTDAACPHGPRCDVYTEPRVLELKKQRTLYEKYYQ
jgi:hypothetical protein